MPRKPPLIKDGIRDGLTGVSHRYAQGLRTLLNEKQDMWGKKEKKRKDLPLIHWRREAMDTTKIS